MCAAVIYPVKAALPSRLREFDREGLVSACICGGCSITQRFGIAHGQPVERQKGFV